MGHAEGAPDVGLQAHDLLEPGERPALGMVSEQQVDRVAPGPQGVGQQHLAHLEVDAHQDPRDLFVSGRHEDARVGVGIDERSLTSNSHFLPSGRSSNSFLRTLEHALRRRLTPRGSAAMPASYAVSYMSLSFMLPSPRRAAATR